MSYYHDILPPQSLRSPLHRSKFINYRKEPQDLIYLDFIIKHIMRLAQHIASVLLLFIFGYSLPAVAQTVFPHDTRSDSIAITHYDLRIDLRDFSSYILKGEAKVVFSPLVNGITAIRLDLLGLTVDSVLDPAGNQLSFASQTGSFTVGLGTGFNAGDLTSVRVFYHGDPVEDPVFGGFYFNAAYAYNVGVSLQDIPHNYGKTWFPCFDDFTTRSAYDLYITTLPQHNAVCGGVYQSTVINADLSETHHWKITQTIPSYLVSAAVSNYVFVNDTFTNYLNVPVPVQLAAKAADTTNMKNSFVNLENAFDIFESKWGPYRWDRVGYVLVPMTSGAMEHAMNIAFPLLAANGGLSWQSVMTHELSHHWWGNLVTCRTAEDMWINEGSAVYSEYVFTENFQGRAAYEQNVRSKHKELLRLCHIDDAGYWPLSGVPQEHTYGSTTYTKGADMIHSLRAYLGDTLFFNGLQDLLEQNQFSDIDAIEYRDDLSAITGVNLDNFFADWIFQGGWPHISIDSINAVPAGANYTVTVHLRQKLVGRTNYSHQVPVLLTLRNSSWNTFETTVLADGQTNTVTVSVPFLPTLAFLNRNELISHAVTANYGTITATGTQNWSHANITLQVQSVTDPAYVVVEHHWAGPDAVQDLSHGWIISPQRFWRVDGIWPAGFSTNATLRYGGALTGPASHLDHLLITGVEDSLILLYRPDRAMDWTEWTGYTKNMGSVNDKNGTMSVVDLQKGEYAFAMRAGNTVGLKESQETEATIFPNPVSDVMTVESRQSFEILAVMNVNGEVLIQQRVKGKKAEVSTLSFAPGVYFVSGYADGKKLFDKKVVVE